MFLHLLILSISLFSCVEYAQDPFVGVFKKNDPQLQGLLWGNWGSRPYEYYWISRLMPIEGKRVIDLGVGLPSQYNWYSYVVNSLKPSFYAGIDCDTRIIAEEIRHNQFEMRYMGMDDIGYPDKSFDIAYCISTFEHIPYDVFMKCIQEAHRVLTDDGVLLITLDEEWDKNEAVSRDNGWNTLEQSLIHRGLFTRKNRSFGLPEFLHLIKDYFELYNEDAVVNYDNGVITSKTSHKIYYNRKNKDQNILHSPIAYNSCVSYAILKKVQ